MLETSKTILRAFALFSDFYLYMASNQVNGNIIFCLPFKILYVTQNSVANHNYRTHF